MPQDKYKRKGIKELKQARSRYSSSSKTYKRLSSAIARKRQKRYASKTLLERIFG